MFTIQKAKKKPNSVVTGGTLKIKVTGKGNLKATGSYIITPFESKVPLRGSAYNSNGVKP